MSVHVMSWVLRNSKAQLGERLVLLVLADHAKDDGTAAWPSVETIAANARLSRSQVQRCLRGLEASGAIVETGQSSKGTHIYTVVTGGPQIDTPEGVTGAASAPDRGRTMRPDPSLEQPSEDQELATEPSDRPRDLVWDELVELFGAVPERRGRRRTNARDKRNKAVADLKDFAATPLEIRAAFNAWPKVFAGATCTDVALATHFGQLRADLRMSPRHDLKPVEAPPEISDEEREANVRRIQELREAVAQVEVRPRRPE